MKFMRGLTSTLDIRLAPSIANMKRLPTLATRLCTMLWIGLSYLPSAGAQTVTYIHTDSIGSVVAETDADGRVIKRYDYEPYGTPVGDDVTGGPKYTGHVSDPTTSLTYMQQRYMDPRLGIFLSADPAEPYAQPIDQFNRYRYSNSNPYRFLDPDGRQAAERAYGAAVGYMLRNDPEAARVWSAGEGAAGTEGSGSEQGAAMGRLAGEFMDTGNFSKEAVAGAIVKGIAAGVVKGKYTPGGRFSRTTKQKTAERAERQCEYCGTSTVQARQSQAGVTPPKNEGVTDHIQPRSQGGDNSPNNAAHACRDCNGKLSDTPKPHPRNE